MKPLSVSSFSFVWFVFVSLLCTCCLCTENSNPFLCIKTEKLMLLRFKNDLIDGANRLSSWNNEDDDCCRWAGVVCDNITGHVHELHLRGPDDGLHGHCHGVYDTDSELEDASRQMLGGIINPSLINLKQLRYLDLSCNDFGFTQIPAFIGSLQNIEYLNLSKSQFDGDIPHQLGNLSMLRVLDLQNVPLLSSLRLENLKWLSNLRFLHHLDMGGIDLTGDSDWFQVINTLSSLSELRLSSCGLTEIPIHLTRTNFTSLTVLDLSWNVFDSLLPGWIFHLRKLVSLDLTGCLFHGLVPGTRGGFHNVSSLKILHVSNNEFMNSSSVLTGLSSLPNLVSLDISNCNLSSPILSDLRNMTSLVYLDLSNNQINETIPKSLSNLCNLNTLDLQSNSFFGSLSELLENLCECESPKLGLLAFRGNYLSGHLPENLGRLKNLASIDLAYNFLTGPIPDSVGNLTLLKTLQINLNALAGPIPDSIGSLASLEFLDLSYNQFNGSVPETIGQLGKLSFLSLYHNSLTGFVNEDHFANLTALKTLRAEDNRLAFKPRVSNWIPPFQLEVLRIGSWSLGPRFPWWIQSLRNLTELDIANTNISDSLPVWFWNSFSGIIFLNISHNNIVGKLGDLKFLAPEAVLDLSANRLNGPLPAHFNRPDIVFLDLSYNNLSGSLDRFLCPRINEPRQLLVLNLADNNLSGVVPDCWKNWGSLAVINFEKNTLSGKIPLSLGNMSSLESLDMRNNMLSGSLPASLLNSKSLLIIELAENELTGRIPRAIGREDTRLKLLSLRSNKLEGEIPDELCHLTSLQILDLAHNNLSGNLPTCFDDFGVISGNQSPSPIILYDTLFQNQVLGSASLVTKGRVSLYSSILYLVTTLDLSENDFYGSIPDELVALRGLRYLNLSRNGLSGRIPEKMGEMRLLESLDLSENRLGGKIPLSISLLSSLNLLNVSYNDLTGRIPTSTQLQSFNESSFVGNSLCGPPLAPCSESNGDPNGTDKEGNQSDDGFDWVLVICTVLGLVAGFWAVVGPLLVSRSWRNAYYRFLHETRIKIHDAVRGTLQYCKSFFETRSSNDVQEFDLSQYIY